MREAGIEDVRRLRLLAVTVRGQDDLLQSGEYFVPDSVATLAVRRLRRRARVMFLIGFVLFTGFVVGANLLVDRFDELLATGEATLGVVVGGGSGLRGSAGYIDVRFSVAGVERTRSMNLDNSSPVLEVGDPITVFYDRDDPDRIAAQGRVQRPVPAQHPDRDRVCPVGDTAAPGSDRPCQVEPTRSRCPSPWLVTGPGRGRRQAGPSHPLSHQPGPCDDRGHDPAGQSPHFPGISHRRCPRRRPRQTSGAGVHSRSCACRGPYGSWPTA